MTTVQLLTTELSNLLSHTKRRNTELREASEHSLKVLRSFAGGDENAFFKQLAKDESFLTPFFIACSTRNVKYCTSATTCLQHLINKCALPKSQLDQVLDALNEATNLGIDIQLKILQCLTPLVENYRTDIQDQLVASTLQVCAKLQERKNNNAVQNTASASLQQITVIFFDKVKNTPDDNKHEVELGNKKVEINTPAHDALRLFIDICHLLERQPVLFLRVKELSEVHALELLEDISKNNKDLFLNREEFAYHLRMSAVPTLLRFFTEKRDFAVFIRVVRVLSQLLSGFLPVLRVECEVILSMLIQCIDDKKNPYWKRVLCMEVLKDMCMDFDLVLDLFQEYDSADERRNSIRDFIQSLDKISSEDSKVIGWQQVPQSLVIHTDANGDIDETMYKTPGISSRISTPKSRCVDMLDKTSAPHFTDSYLYYLVLTCVLQLSQQFSQHVSPVKPESQNDLTLHRVEPKKADKHHDASPKFVEQCWSDVLSIYTTFLHATMDDGLYHGTVKAAQRFGHASGILQLPQTRDAFMVLLGKFTVLVSSSQSANGAPSRVASPRVGSVESLVNTVQPRTASIASQEHSRVTFTPNNVYCCRALLNLAVSLGPELGDSWTIIAETLQSVDALLNRSSNKRYSSAESNEFLLGGDFNKADKTLKRLIESTREFDAAAVDPLLEALIGVSALTLGLESGSKLEIVGIGKPQDGDPCFLIDFLGAIGQHSVGSFDNSNWQKLVGYLSQVITSRAVPGIARLRAGKVLNTVSYQAMVECSRDENVQQRVLGSLQQAVHDIVELEPPDEGQSVSATSADLEIHVGIIENVVQILDHCGGRLVHGWDVVLDITNSVFKPSDQKSSAIVKSGFEGIQLVCNDFLQSLPEGCLLQLVDILFQFCNQHDRDINTSFSAISFFWIVCDHLRTLGKSTSHIDKMDVTDAESLMTVAQTEGPLRVHALWMVALLRLTDIAQIPHPQVRATAIQILFRVLDSHGAYLPVPVWEACQLVVMPTIMSIRPPRGQLSEWDETMRLLLGGVSSLYKAFAPIFTKQARFPELWDQFIKYLANVDEYAPACPPQLSVKVYEGLESVLHRYLEKDVALPAECLQQTWDFWYSREKYTKIDAVVDAKVTQDGLTALVNLHGPLYDLDGAKAAENIDKSVQVLESCASFQALPPLYKDQDHLTPLQSGALKQVLHIDFTVGRAPSLVLSLLSNLIRLPFTREVQESNDKFTTPTYVALCERTLKSILAKLDLVIDKSSGQVDAALVSDGTCAAVLAAVNVPMTAKFQCPIIRIGDDAQHSVQLWQLAATIVREVVAAVVTLEINSELWRLILQCITAVLATTRGNPLENDDEFETFDITMYKSIVVDTLGSNSDHVPQWVFDELVAYLYTMSKLYEPVRPWMDKIDDTTVEPFRGTTATPYAVARPRVAYLCIDDMCRLDGRAAGWLQLRAANVLRQYICDRPLRGKMPMLAMLQRELEYILQTLQRRRPVGAALYSLLVRATTVAAPNDHDVLQLIQELL